jgi:hypothetical protein
VQRTPLNLATAHGSSAAPLPLIGDVDLWMQQFTTLARLPAGLVRTVYSLAELRNKTTLKGIESSLEAVETYVDSAEQVVRALKGYVNRAKGRPSSPAA